MKITSLHNQKVLAVRKLYKSNDRKKSDLFIAEGRKEVERGFVSGFKASYVFYCSEITDSIMLEQIISGSMERPEIFDLDKAVYEKIAYRDKTEGVLALFYKKTYSLEEIVPGENDIYLILESVEKPGNLGAILRTADAAGIKGIILSESKVDQYHPNVIRSSLGAVYRIPVVVTGNTQVMKWLKDYDIKSVAAALPSYNNIYTIDLRGNIAIVFGAEAEGLSEFWIKNADELFTIPMRGIVDSLNVSVSVAISVYEALRQAQV
jgi:TrmH family RNA methyltransferase